MKIIITENKLERIIVKWLNSEYGDLEPYETNEHPNYIFFIKNGEVVFDYNKKNGVVIVSFNHIWSFLSSFFGLDNEDIKGLTKDWVEEHYKLRVMTIMNAGNDNFVWRGIITN